MSRQSQGYHNQTHESPRPAGNLKGSVCERKIDAHEMRHSWMLQQGETGDYWANWKILLLCMQAESLSSKAEGRYETRSCERYETTRHPVSGKKGRDARSSTDGAFPHNPGRKHS